ncbi:MAG: glycosyltransferase family 2 protein [Candidatus Nanoarchaeia archaeon]
MTNLKQPKVSIIVLNWNGKKYLQKCLDSVFNIDYKNYEVLFVDNASTDGSVNFVKKQYQNEIKSKKLKLVLNDKDYGFAEGNNIAIRQVLKDKSVNYICLLNNDTIVDKNWLSALVNFAEKNSKIGIVGSKIYYLDQPNKINFAGGKVNLWTGSGMHIGDNELDRGQYNFPKKVDYITGASMCIKREVFEKIGFFPEEFFCYWEDTDFSFRARKAGYELWYVPDSKIWHKVSASFNAFGAYCMYRNSVWFMKKHASLFQFFIFVIYKFIRLCGATIFGRPYLKEKWKGFLDGLFAPKPHFK